MVLFPAPNSDAVFEVVLLLAPKPELEPPEPKPPKPVEVLLLLLPKPNDMMKGRVADAASGEKRVGAQCAVQCNVVVWERYCRA